MKHRIFIIGMVSLLLACEAKSPISDESSAHGLILIGEEVGAPLPEHMLEEACAQGESLACHELAYRLSPKLLGERELLDDFTEKRASRERRLELLERACFGGYYDACADAQREVLGLTNTPDVRHRETLERACRLGYRRSCIRIALEHLDGQPALAGQAYAALRGLGADVSYGRGQLELRGVDLDAIESGLPWVLTRAVDLDEPTTDSWSRRDALCKKQEYPVCKDYTEPPRLKNVRPDSKASRAERKAFQRLQSICSRDVFEAYVSPDKRCQQAGELLYQRVREIMRAADSDALKTPSHEAVLWLEQACLNHHPQSCRVLGDLAFLNGAFHLAESSLARVQYRRPFDPGSRFDLLNRMIMRRNIQEHVSE